jgi:phosphoglycolate phosphatase-like HAD superfamily hydrolase
MLTGYNPPDKLQEMRPDLICNHLGELQQFLAAQEVARG